MDSLGAINLGTGRTAIAISAGNQHTCALLDGGDVKCWGTGLFGRLGQDSTVHFGRTESETDSSLSMASLGAINLGTGRTATAISASRQHTCALLDGGDVKCWGEGNKGELGQDSTDSVGDGLGEDMDSLGAINLGTGRTAIAISAGNQHTCALLDGGDVKCWGTGLFGRLGQDSTVHFGRTESETDSSLSMASLGAINLGTGRTATAISAGKQHTCALLDGGDVKCWGENISGQLGQDTSGGTEDSRIDIGDGLGEMGALPAIDLGTVGGPVDELSADATPYGFFAKFDKDGKNQWVRQLEGGDSDIRGIAVDSSDNVYITGYFSGTANFDPGGTEELTSNGNEDVFFAKYDTNGIYQWAHDIGGSDGDEGQGIAVDSDGNVYITGKFKGIN
ncbi:uncharacterized protein METZ01_LOCUS219805, partial [marine metagenome]